MSGLAYILGTAIGLVSGFLLLRNFRRTKVQLLLWCGLFFLALSVENAILFVDLILVPHVNLEPLRLSIALLGMALFLYALIWKVN